MSAQAGHGASVHIEACGKTFADGTRALEPATLDIARGETLVLLGPSGCGKTTMLRIIAGLEVPDAGGRVLFDGKDMTAVPIERRNVGMVFQSYALFPNMTVSDNIGYGLKIRGIPAKERAARVAELVALTNISGLENRRIDQLSGGQRQRVALARAVAIRPGILLLDEPLTALDAALRDRLRGELNRLLRALGITTIYVTHDQSEAMELGDRVVVMQKGAIAQIGTPREIYFTPRSRFVAEFIGAANIVEAAIEDGHLVLPGGRQPIHGDMDMPAAVAMIRPETIRVTAAGSAPLSGIIDSVSFIGDRQRLVVSGASNRLLTVDAPNTVQVKARRTDRIVDFAGRRPPVAARELRRSMSPKPVHIAQISDLHIKPPGSLAYGKVDTAKALERCVAALNEFDPAPDFVVISGDLADTPTAEEYQYLKRLLAPLKLPFAGIPGNHDSRELMRAAFPSASYAFVSGPLNQKIEVAGLDLLLLDSSVHRKPHGELDGPTLQWLDGMLASSPDRPALLFLHHPPFKAGIWHMDRQNLLNASDLAPIVRRHPRVQLIATGHVHRATLTMFAGVPTTICPAPNHAVDLDLAELRQPSFKVEPPAFHLHTWFPGEGYGNVVTHQVPIGTFDGPHPFFAADGKLL